MISIDEASCADVFHYRPPGESACEVWVRDGQTRHYQDGWFCVPVATRQDPPATRDWWAVMRHNAVFFHTPENCPHATPAPVPPAQAGPDLASTIGYDVFGYDVFGYDALGYDEDGYDREGYDARGFDAEGFDRDGYDREGYDLDGDDRYGRNRRPLTEELNLADEWREFPGYNQTAFLEHLREKVRDPGSIDEVSFCDRCNEPAWSDDLRRGGDGEDYCDSCWDDLSYCNSCDEKFPGSDLTETLGGSDICDSCLSSYYSFCEYCDGYYPDDDSYEHDHDDGSGCCESPQLAFRIRNDGCDPLGNDQRVTITLAKGVITSEGLKAIRRYLLDAGAGSIAYDLADVGDQWQARTGNFPKRLSRLAYQRYQTKLTPENLSNVGNIARDHSTEVSVRIEVTRDLNQSADYFYHDGSCWWTDYYESRCALKTNGGFALLSFNQHGGTSGRAWVLPLKLDGHEHLTPTFETMTPDAFVVFNGYGDLYGYTASRIIAHLAGWTYRKIDFECSPMYINSGGYLVAPEPVAEKYTDGELRLSVSQHSSLYDRERKLAHVQ